VAGNYWQGKHTIIEAKDKYALALVLLNGQDLDVQAQETSMYVVPVLSYFLISDFCVG
jgi:hypothetical protein